MRRDLAWPVQNSRPVEAAHPDGSEITIDVERRRLLLSFRGLLTGEAMISQLHREEPVYSQYPSFDRLNDLSEADMGGVTPEALRLLQEAVRRVDLRVGFSGRVAIVAPTDLAFGLTRMFQLGGDTRESPQRVFRSAEEAHRWLDGTFGAPEA